MNAVERALVKKVLDFVMVHLEEHADKSGPLGQDVEQLLKDIQAKLDDALSKM